MAFKIIKEWMKEDKGFTLMELLTVIGILVILAIMIFLVLNPMTQIRKGHDAKRKADLTKLKTVFEDYYNDNNCYPETDSWEEQLVPDYIRELPTDPNPSQSYEYSRPDCDTYRIYAKLEYEQDPLIAEAGCEDGCGPGGGTPGGSCAYNYGACSPNAELESCALCTIGCQPGGPVGQLPGVCNDLNRCNGVSTNCWICPPGKWFCSWDKCEERCPGNPEYYCTHVPPPI